MLLVSTSSAPSTLFSEQLAFFSWMTSGALFGCVKTTTIASNSSAGSDSCCVACDVTATGTSSRHAASSVSAACDVTMTGQLCVTRGVTMIESLSSVSHSSSSSSGTASSDVTALRSCRHVASSKWVSTSCDVTVIVASSISGGATTTGTSSTHVASTSRATSGTDLMSIVSFQERALSISWIASWRIHTTGASGSVAAAVLLGFVTAQCLSVYGEASDGDSGRLPGNQSAAVDV